MTKFTTVFFKSPEWKRWCEVSVKKGFDAQAVMDTKCMTEEHLTAFFSWQASHTMGKKGGSQKSEIKTKKARQNWKKAIHSIKRQTERLVV